MPRFLRLFACAVALVFPLTFAAGASANNTGVVGGTPAHGELDCNGDSPAQSPARYWNCTDIRGFDNVDNQNTWGGKFYDNGQYIGHDEPDLTFLSSRPGSGDNVTWTLTLGKDPRRAPTDANPGRDVSHWFELTPAPWLSMAICDPNSYPQAPCTPESDSNAPTSTNGGGGGSAFLEMQFYPPGNPPFVDAQSCDDSHWCAALTIDSLECTTNFANCNGNCEEPLNAAFVQRDGVPAAAPGPQSYPDNQFPNRQTLLMSPGDTVRVHMWDAPVPGEPGRRALEVVIDDLSTGQSGFMQASGKNGFQTTSMSDCSGTDFNFQPEYSTASQGNIIPWAALATNISTEFETGHWEPCTSLSDPIANPVDTSDSSQAYNECNGPYERAGGPDSGSAEAGDAFCFKQGDTHNGFNGPGTSTDPDLITGCQDNVFQNGDLDFDGSPYWTEWPTSANPTNLYPGSFVEGQPTTVDARTGRTDGYGQFQFQTDIALSESQCTPTTLSGCTVPPVGPGGFYPYWSQSSGGGRNDQGNGCTWEFGNVSDGVNTYGKDAQYGTNLFATLGYPEFESKIYRNDCGGPSQQ
jgi:hypothetical protein